MDDFASPRLEKRMLPLLDLTLSLVGMLILMVGLSNEDPTTGIANEVVHFETLLSGDIVLEDRVIASNDGGIDEVQLQRVLIELESLDDPLIIIYYPSPAADSQVDANLVSTFKGRLITNGHTVRTVEKPDAR